MFTVITTTTRNLYSHNNMMYESNVFQVYKISYDIGPRVHVELSMFIINTHLNKNNNNP